jgi:hypothetical protein
MADPTLADRFTNEFNSVFDAAFNGAFDAAFVAEFDTQLPNHFPDANAFLRIDNHAAAAAQVSAAAKTSAAAARDTAREAALNMARDVARDAALQSVKTEVQAQVADLNAYADMKTVAKGFMDSALIMANVTLLLNAHALSIMADKEDPQYVYYFILMALVIISTLLQFWVFYLLYSVYCNQIMENKFDKSVATNENNQRIKDWNDTALGLIGLTTILQIGITALGSAFVAAVSPENAAALTNDTVASTNGTGA